MENISFKPKQVVKKLLSVLPERAKDVIMSRYGLGKDPKKMTLEAIGKKYGITRERVRQIEQKVIQKLKEHAGLQKILGIEDDIAKLEANEGKRKKGKRMKRSKPSVRRSKPSEMTLRYSGVLLFSSVIRLPIRKRI